MRCYASRTGTRRNLAALRAAGSVDGRQIDDDGFGDYSKGRYCWEFYDVETFDPVPTIGRQGFFGWDPP